MIFPVYSLLLIVSSSGIPVVVSRLVSKQIANKNSGSLTRILKSAILLTGIIGFICSLGLFLSANALSNLQGNTLCYVGFLGVAPAILIGSIVGVFRGFFEGLQNMAPTATSEIIEQTAKVGLGLVLANFLLRFGLSYGVLGAVLGITLGEIISFIAIFAMYVFTKKKRSQLFEEKEEADKLQEANTIVEEEPKSYFKLLFKEAIPITLSATILPLTLFLDSLLILNLLKSVGFSTTIATSLFGIQSGVVNSLVHLPMILATSIATAILPTISAANAVNNKEDINFKTSFTIKIVWVLALPCFIGFLLLAKEITALLYGGGLDNTTIDEMQVAINLIKMIAVTIVYHSFLRLFIAVLHALNRSYLVVKNLLFASVIKIVLTVVFVSYAPINIYGAGIASVISYLFAALFSLISIRKLVEFKLKLKEFLIYPLIASASLVLSIYLTQNLFHRIASSSVATLLTIAVSASIYIIVIFVFKVFSQEELNHFAFIKKLKNKLPLKKS